jgi:hypothetical protein
MNEQQPNPGRTLPSLTGLDHEHLIAMGEVAYWAARAERTLALVVTAFISTESEVGVVVTNGMPFTRLLELGSQLAAHRPNDDQARDIYGRLTGPLKGAMDSRNHLLHSEWTKPQQGPASATLTRGKGKIEREFSVEAIRDVASELMRLADRMFILFLVIEGHVDYTELAP